MTRIIGTLLSLLFVTVSCSTSPSPKWEERNISSTGEPTQSLTAYVLPTDEVTVRDLREIRGGLAFTGNSADTQTNIQKVKAAMEKNLNKILTANSGAYITLAKFDKELDAAVTSGQFDLATSPNYEKFTDLRQSVATAEARMLATYVQLWRYALDLDQKDYPVPQGRRKIVSERAREVLAYAHDLVESYNGDVRSIGLISLQDRMDDILDSVALDMSSQTQGSRDALQPLSNELGQLIAQFAKSESKIRTMGLVDYSKSLKDFTDKIAPDADTKKIMDRKPQSNVLVEGFKNKNGSDFPANAWVLTFDDGPHKTRTQGIAKVLADKGIKGEFFWLSKLVKTNKTIAKEIYDAGHHISSHSEDHADLTKQSTARIKEEVSGSRDTIEKTLHDAGATDYKMVNFRCPYGACWAPKSAKVQQAIKDANLTHIYWTVDSLDWQDKNVSSVRDRVIKQMKASKKGIILFHDIHPLAESVMPLLFTDKYVTDNNVKWLQL